MDIELYKLTLDVIGDAVKILGPASITGILVFHQSKLRLGLKIKELDKNNEFKAREKIFEFHKDKLNSVQLSIDSLSNELGHYLGMSVADQHNELRLNSFINRHITNNIKNLPFEVSHIHTELKKYPIDFDAELIRMDAEVENIHTLITPTDPQMVQSTITDLLSIYGFLAHCVRCLIEKEAISSFRPYIVDT
ncbi:hypothetical protein H4J38_04305 [Colwellia sp. BRX10-3]|uniref:hypothetical protein n=1 Tax=Colwellia sp. BRX10-3 TaxID=2759844 RepID=UPI0015F6864C|nr:hypothetical protein [Colwellia sp. BRX10-3]MBA6390001.1 hypothetical protein [Colwellia sp. BRX10-3]